MMPTETITSASALQGDGFDVTTHEYAEIDVKPHTTRAYYVNVNQADSSQNVETATTGPYANVSPTGVTAEHLAHDGYADAQSLPTLGPEPDDYEIPQNQYQALSEPRDGSTQVNAYQALQ